MSSVWLWVACGGAIGACLRYGFSSWVSAQIESDFPWATLFVNVIGSAIMAICYFFAIEKALASDWFKPLVMTGLLGAFTTFSTYSMEAVLLAQKGAIIMASGYVIANACVSILAFCAALYITRILV